MKQQTVLERYHEVDIAVDWQMDYDPTSSTMRVLSSMLSELELFCNLFPRLSGLE